MLRIVSVIGSLGFGLLLSVPAFSQKTEQADSRAAEGGEATDVVVDKVPPAGDALALLLKPVKEVDWDETAFEDILDWLRDQGDNRINVVPRWGSLNNEGVDAEKGVTLKLTNTTVAKVLNEVLEQLSEEGKLRYQASENQVTIASQEYFEKKLVLIVYDIGDILFRVPDFTTEAPQIDLSGQNSGGGGGGGSGGGSGQSVFSGAGGQGNSTNQGGQNLQEVEQARNQLRDLILLTVAPESWADTPSTGGASQLATGNGRVRIYNRSLAVLNTLEVHEQIAGWIELNR